MGKFWNQFQMCVTAYQFVEGALGERYIETGRDYGDVAEFMSDFHQLMWELKTGRLEQVLFDPQSVLCSAVMVRNAAGRRFRVQDIWSDGLEEDEMAEAERIPEEELLEKLLEYYQTEDHFRTPTRWAPVTRELWGPPPRAHGKLYYCLDPMPEWTDKLPTDCKSGMPGAA